MTANEKILSRISYLKDEEHKSKNNALKLIEAFQGIFDTCKEDVISDKISIHVDFRVDILESAISDLAKIRSLISQLQELLDD